MHSILQRPFVDIGEKRGNIPVSHLVFFFIFILSYFWFCTVEWYTVDLILKRKKRNISQHILKVVFCLPLCKTACKYFSPSQPWCFTSKFESYSFPHYIKDRSVASRPNLGFEPLPDIRPAPFLIWALPFSSHRWTPSSPARLCANVVSPSIQLHELQWDKTAQGTAHFCIFFTSLGAVVWLWGRDLSFCGLCVIVA